MVGDRATEPVLADRATDPPPNEAGPSAEGSHPATGSVRWQGRLAWLMVLLVTSAALWVICWTISPARASGDTFWYTKAAFQIAGSHDDEAAQSAATFTVAVAGHGSVAGWIAAVHTVSPRYQAIFAVRPFFPASGALLIPVFGSDAMIVSTFVGGVLVGVVLGLFVLRVTRSRWASLAAVVLVYVLPSGRYLALVYADGWMLTLWVACLAVASLYLLEGRRTYLLALGVLAGLLALTKSANAVVLAVTLVGTALASVVVRGSERRRALSLAAVGSGVAGFDVVGFALLGMPGVTETIQDMFTGHFTRPDVPSPLTRLIQYDVRSLRTWIRGLVGNPITIVVVAVAATKLATARTLWAIIWLLGAASTILVVLLHPVGSEIPRLLIPIWPTVSIGLALWLPTLARSWRQVVSHGRAHRQVPGAD